ncbi:MAG: DHA2 family efflux MFS transporter permease subunit [Sphingomonadales bacterium]|nr:DHA2 family efflux MFS transporter permease subunit [Sphingomonadales bacterium]
MVHAYPPPGRRRLITIFVMAAAVMNVIDTTIANVALPHMQGTTSASREEITWVLTSYIVSAAIFTPLTGWLATRYGRKKLLLVSIVGFTAASGLCGMADTLAQLILFRLLQGVFGSSLLPMSQATLLDINAPENHGQAMAVVGLAAVMGPLLGPLAGGYITDSFSWRWVFYINLPIGAFTFAGLWVFLEETVPDTAARLDWIGFGLLALGLAALQLVLDRGQTLDWFDSTEFCIEVVLALAGFYLFTVHVATTRHAPFVSMTIFRDRNFVIATLLGFALGILIYGAMALIPMMLQTLLFYPTLRVGLVMAPRGLGTLVSTLLVGRLINRIDPRILVSIGLAITGLSMAIMSDLSLAADSRLIILSGIVQGLGASSIFVPLATMTFATLPAASRNEGSALSTLIRNMGASVGIAGMEALTYRNAATVQSRLTETLTPDNPLLRYAMPALRWNSPAALDRLEMSVQRQAMMVSYIDAFWLLFLIGMLAAPCVFLLRRPRRLRSGPRELAELH